MAKENKQRDFRFEIKEVTDEGTFEGLASVYGVLDNGGDIVERGAFSRTIKARPEVKILWRHDQPIGKGVIADSEKGLVIKGRLTLAVNQAREALALMKDGVVDGLSIGYRSIKDEITNGIRHLKEVKLYEVSLTPMPLNEEAMITSVKESNNMERKDFVEDLDRIQTGAGHYMMMQALDSALYDCLWGTEDAETRTANASASIDQFKAAYVEWFPRYMTMRGVKEAAELEIKEGRKLSADTRAKLEAAMVDHRTGMEKIQALLDADTDSGKESKSDTGPAKQDGTDPETIHSALKSLLNSI